ncbi:phage tail assembly protein [Bradyrhizobium sp. 170]|uniref:phage tail assembly protein n=1 Tax=Bradyrhizobium sp. 170 TaxID=2782641 RepID=UPI001FFF288E|nr:phage tail assembly protein [Bradyrhizobium sp. 170]UPK03102.1 phage tail assembly protein [Bradyrhizobium sp. 170]
MNVNPKHEGFVDDQATKPEAEIISPSNKRAMPPPEIEPPPEELPPLELDEWPIIVKLLYKPIRNNRGEEVREVSLREPRAGDINRYGNPIRVNQDGDVIIDERKMTYMIGALSNILPPFIEEMDPRDWNSCAYRLRRFFLPDPAAW